MRVFLQGNAFPIGLWAALRGWTLLWAAVTLLFVPPAPNTSRFYYEQQPLRDAITAPWQRWDTIWYVKLAAEGYARDARAVFAPLYPFLIWVLEPLTLGNGVAAGLIVSSAAAVASFVLLYQLARQMFDESAARRALIFLAAFPTAFFLFAAYTEALFLALALAAFLCARHKSWGWAGIFGGLAAMTRPQGILFILPLAVAFWEQARRSEISWARVWALLPVALGGIAHFAWLTVKFGTPAVWVEAQTIWHTFTLPSDALGAAWGAVVNAPSPVEGALSFLDPFVALLLLASLIGSVRKLPASMTVYTATIVLPPLFVVTTYSGTYPLTAVARYALVAFPFFLLLGTLAPKRWHSLWLAVSFLIQTIGLMLFAAWVFVR